MIGLTLSTAKPTARPSAASLASWVLYHFAYEAFPAVVATFVFATYFTQAVARDPIAGTAQWAATQAAAGVVIALLAVPLGVIADRCGRRRAMLAISTVVLVLSTGALWWVRPHAGDVALALILVGIATVAFEVATIFYNAMLPELALPAELGKLSMRAWGAGYAGGLASLAVCLLVLVLPAVAPFGLDRAHAEPVRACAVVAAAWIAAFGWPVLVFGPADPKVGPWRAAVRQGLGDILPVMAAAWRDKRMRRFVLARLFFMDGLTTLFAFGGIYAAGQFGLSATEVLVFGIGLAVTAGLGVVGCALIEDRIGSRATILLSLLALIGLSTVLLLIHDHATFWVVGLLLGVFVGPAQAASRTLMARIAPPGEIGCYFGVLALSGRVTSFAGPLALSAVTALTASQRAGMAVIIVFLVAGAALIAAMPRESSLSPVTKP